MTNLACMSSYTLHLNAPHLDGNMTAIPKSCPLSCCR
jgi:hypothetical protein